MPVCVDCKYFQPETFFTVQEDCDHPQWCVSEKCHPTMRTKKEYVEWETRRPSVFNAKCDCELYERKWWKFWA